MSSRIEVRQGSITDLDVDAVVNAANRSLLGGGGVDGAIHRAAGPGLLEECRPLGGCETGDVKATGGHNLLARHVIHTVGPIWRGGEAEEVETLAGCYRKSMHLADALNCRSVAFPAISTGAYGMPHDLAAKTALGAVAGVLPETRLERVVMVSIDARTARHLRNASKSLGIELVEGGE